jgi:hypothetical protein
MLRWYSHASRASFSGAREKSDSRSVCRSHIMCDGVIMEIFDKEKKGGLNEDEEQG